MKTAIRITHNHVANSSVLCTAGFSFKEVVASTSRFKLSGAAKRCVNAPI